MPKDDYTIREFELAGGVSIIYLQRLHDGAHFGPFQTRAEAWEWLEREEA